MLSTGSELSSSARLALIALCLHSNAEGKSWPTVELLREETGLKKTRMSEALKELEEFGVMTREPLFRQFKFTVHRDVVVSMMEKDESGPDSEPDSTESGPDSGSSFPDSGRSFPDSEPVQKRTKKGTKKREESSLAFQEWIGELPPEMRKDLGQLEKLWDAEVEDPAPVVAWTIAAREEIELPTAARFILSDRKWLDEVWPGAEKARKRQADVDALKDEHGEATWWTLFDAWVSEDVGRPVDLDVFWDEEMSNE